MRLYEIIAPDQSHYAVSARAARELARKLAMETAAAGGTPGISNDIPIQELKTGRVSSRVAVHMLNGQRDAWIESERTTERFEISWNKEGTPSIQLVVFQEVEAE